MIIVIRVKGGFKIKQQSKDTLKFLRLNRNHHCVLLKDNPVNKGMINKVRGYVTWGEINESTLAKLIQKRGRLPGGKRVDLTDKKLESVVKDLISGKKSLADFKINPVFRLSPPKKGWDHGTIKLEFPRGALGPRGTEINKLILKMI